MKGKLPHIVLSAVMLFILLGGAVFAAIHVPVFIDGDKLISDVEPQIISGRTMVPMAVIADSFGAEVKWIEATKTVEITSPAQKFMDGYGEKNMYVSNATSMLVAYNAGRAVILDVRPDAQRDLGYIEGSLHIPMAALLDRMGELPKDKIIGVYCAKNINAAYAVAILNMQGYDAYVLENGVTAWRAAGGIITTDAACLP